MHIEFLTEDSSGGIFLNSYLNVFFGDRENISWNVHSYSGIGKIPTGLNPALDPNKRLLLDQMPRLLRGFAKTPYVDMVFVILDTDNRNKEAFLTDLISMIPDGTMSDKVVFCLATEELEAWYFGDRSAIIHAYPNAKIAVLKTYIQDSVCGTWGRLADALYPGGMNKVRQIGWPLAGIIKCEWAEQITPHMSPTTNLSPSFQVFRDQINSLVIEQT